MKKFNKKYIEAVDYVLNHPEWNNTKLGLYEQYCHVIDPNDQEWTNWDKDCEKCNLLNDLSKEDMLAILFGEYEYEIDNLELFNEYMNDHIENYNEYIYNDLSKYDKFYYISLGVIKCFDKIQELGLKIVKVDE